MRRSTSSIFLAWERHCCEFFAIVSGWQSSWNISDPSSEECQERQEVCLRVFADFLRCINCKVVCYTNLPPPPLVRHFVSTRCVKTQRKRLTAKRLTTRPGVLCVCVYIKETVLESHWSLWSRPESYCKKKQLCCRPDLLSLTAALCVWTRGHLWFYVCDMVSTCIRPPSRWVRSF